MLNGGFKNLPPDSWKPFGNGVRGCIGRQFAWQEVLLLVAMVCLPLYVMMMLTYRSFNHSILDHITRITNSSSSIPLLSNHETSICTPHLERAEISVPSSVVAQREQPTRKSMGMDMSMDLLERWILVSITVSLYTLDTDVS